MKKTFLAVAVAFTMVASASAQNLLEWNTSGNSGTELSEPSTYNDPGVAPSSWTHGPGVTPAGNANRFGGSNWWDTGDSTSTTRQESISGNDYMEFTVTPTPGVTASFTATQLSFIWHRSSTGPDSVALYYSTDNSTWTLLGSVEGMAQTSNTFQNINFNLTESTTTTFRLYGYGATAASGTGGFDRGSIGTDPNIFLVGSTTPVPEPATVIGGLLGVAGLCWHQRQRVGRLLHRA